MNTKQFSLLPPQSSLPEYPTSKYIKRLCLRPHFSAKQTDKSKKMCKFANRKEIVTR